MGALIPLSRLNDNRTAHLPSSLNSGGGVVDHRVVSTTVRSGYAAASGWLLGDMIAMTCRVRRANITPDSYPSILTRTACRGEISRGWGGPTAETLYRRGLSRPPKPGGQRQLKRNRNSGTTERAPGWCRRADRGRLGRRIIDHGAPTIESRSPVANRRAFTTCFRHPSV